jgi:hypothetical protein
MRMIHTFSFSYGHPAPRCLVSLMLDGSMWAAGPVLTNTADLFYSSNSNQAGQSVALSGNGLRRAVSAPYETVSFQPYCGKVQISTLNITTGVWSIDITLSCPATDPNTGYGYQLLGYGMPGLVFNDNGTLLVASAVMTDTPSSSITKGSGCPSCFAVGLVYRLQPSGSWSLVHVLDTSSQIAPNRGTYSSNYAIDICSPAQLNMVLSVAMSANGTRVVIGSPYSQGGGSLSSGSGSASLFYLANASTGSTVLPSEITWAFTVASAKCGAGVGVSDSDYPFQVLVGCLGGSFVYSFTKTSAASSWPTTGTGKSVALSNVCTIALAANGRNALAGVCASSTGVGAVQPLAWTGTAWQLYTPGWVSGFSGTGDYFGSSLAISADGNTAVVGAFGRNAVLVFKMNGTTAAAMNNYYVATLVKTAGTKPQISTADSYFGATVAMASNWNMILVSNLANPSNLNTKPVLIPYSLVCTANCLVCTVAGCATCATGFVKTSSGITMGEERVVLCVNLVHLQRVCMRDRELKDAPSHGQLSFESHSHSSVSFGFVHHSCPLLSVRRRMSEHFVSDQQLLQPVISHVHFLPSGYFVCGRCQLHVSPWLQNPPSRVHLVRNRGLLCGRHQSGILSSRIFLSQRIIVSHGVPSWFLLPRRRVGTRGVSCTNSGFACGVDCQQQLRFPWCVPLADFFFAFCSALKYHGCVDAVVAEAVVCL